MAYTPTSAPTVTTPAAVASYVAQVDGEIRALNDDMLRDINAGRVDPSAWGAARNLFVDDWQAWSAAYLDAGYLVTLPGDAWNQVAQYQAKNEVWREKFIGWGGTSIAPGPQKLRDPGEGWLLPLVVGAVAAGGVALWIATR